VSDPETARQALRPLAVRIDTSPRLTSQCSLLVPRVTASIVLYWLPLGAGGRSVRWNGRVFEAAVSRLEHRAAQDLYHSALEVRVGKKSYVIEMTPVWVGEAGDRGVVREGPVGLRWLGRFRMVL